MRGPTAHPGYLSVRLLHCQGHGRATRSGGSHVGSSFSGAAVLWGRGGVREGFSQRPGARKLREGHGTGWWWWCDRQAQCSVTLMAFVPVAPQACWPWEHEHVWADTPPTSHKQR